MRWTKSVKATKVSDLVWAKGVLAIHQLGAGSMATTTPRLNKCNFKAAISILRAHPDDSEAVNLLEFVRRG